MVCTRCGIIDADARPNWREQPARETLGIGLVATLVRALRRSDADCLTCACDIVDADRLRPGEGDVRSTYRPIGACLEVWFFQNVLGDATMILPRAVFTEVGGFPVGRESWEAHEFLLRLCLRGFRLETFPEPIYYYRESASGRGRK